MSDTDLDFTQIWQNTIATLDADGLPARERAFLTLARLAGLLDGTALVKVPNDYTKDVVEQRVRDAVTRALSSQLGEQVQLAVTVDTSLDETHHIDRHHRVCRCRPAVLHAGRPAGHTPRHPPGRTGRQRSALPGGQRLPAHPGGRAAAPAA